MENISACCAPGCKLAPVIDGRIPLCEVHYKQIGLRFIDERTVGGRVFKVAERQSAKERHERLLAEHIANGEAATAHRKRLAEKSVVYYVRAGRYVKIGFTSDIRRRMSELRLHMADILATEPGGRALESQRHAQFADERIGKREDFAPSLRIQEHIRELQEIALESAG